MLSGCMIFKGDLKMKKNRKFLIVMLTVILGACGNSSAESNAELDNQSSSSSLTQDVNADLSNKDSTNEDKNTPENASEGSDNTQTDNEEDIANDTATSSNAEGLSKSSSGNGEIMESKKDEYLQKLNNAKNVTQEFKASDSSTYALKKVENDRWAIWDELLNEIYGVLKEQLQPVEMDRLREEQQNWMKYRDESALEASLKFKGGTQEYLEYVTVLVNLTEERCHELVEDYIK